MPTYLTDADILDNFTGLTDDDVIEVQAGKPKLAPPKPKPKPKKAPRQPVSAGIFAPGAKPTESEATQKARLFGQELAGPPPEPWLDTEGTIYDVDQEGIRPQSTRRRTDETLDAYLKRAGALEEDKKVQEQQARRERAQVRAKSLPMSRNLRQVVEEVSPTAAAFMQSPGVGESIGALLELGSEKYPTAFKTGADEGFRQAGNQVMQLTEAFSGSPMTGEVANMLRQLPLPNLNQKEAEEYWVKQAQSLGAMYPALAISWHPVGRILGTAYMGLQSGGEIYDDAINNGATPEEAFKASIPAIGIGLLQGLLGTGTGKWAENIAKGNIKSFAKNWAEEQFQEVILDQGLKNVNAKYLSGYAPKRALTEGMWETFLQTIPMATAFHAPGLAKGGLGRSGVEFSIGELAPEPGGPRLFGGLAFPSVQRMEFNGQPTEIEAIPDPSDPSLPQVSREEAQANLAKFMAQSQVKNEAGEPIPLYHGTQSPTEIQEIDPSKFDKGALYGPGFYMTQDPEVAAGEGGYSTTKLPSGVRSGWGVGGDAVVDLGPWDASDYEASNKIIEQYFIDHPGLTWNDLDYREGGKVDTLIYQDRLARKGPKPHAYKLYADIRNPLDIDAIAESNLIDKVEYMDGARGREGRLGSNIDNRTLYEKIVRYFNGDKGLANQWLQQQGYDGITHTGGRSRGTPRTIGYDEAKAQEEAQRAGGRVTRDPDTGEYQVEGHRTWIAFEPTQIKSATGNRGDYNPSNPNISFSLANEPNRITYDDALGAEMHLRDLAKQEGRELTVKERKYIDDLYEKADKVVNLAGEEKLDLSKIKLKVPTDPTRTPTLYVPGSLFLKLGYSGAGPMGVEAYGGLMLEDSSQSKNFRQKMSENLTPEEYQEVDAQLRTAEAVARSRGIQGISITNRDTSFGNIRGNLRHESWHVGQTDATRATSLFDPSIIKETLLDLHSPDMNFHPIVKKAGESAMGKAVMEASGNYPDVLAMELSAYFAAGQNPEFGITDEEAAQYLTDYLSDIVENRGITALDTLVSRAWIKPSTKETIQKVRSKYEGPREESTGTGTGTGKFSVGQPRGAVPTIASIGNAVGEGEGTGTETGAGDVGTGKVGEREAQKRTSTTPLYVLRATNEGALKEHLEKGSASNLSFGVTIPDKYENISVYGDVIMVADPRILDKAATYPSDAMTSTYGAYQGIRLPDDPKLRYRTVLKNPSQLLLSDNVWLWLGSPEKSLEGVRGSRYRQGVEKLEGSSDVSRISDLASQLQVASMDLGKFIVKDPTNFHQVEQGRDVVLRALVPFAYGKEDITGAADRIFKAVVARAKESSVEKRSGITANQLKPLVDSFVEIAENYQKEIRKDPSPYMEAKIGSEVSLQNYKLALVPEAFSAEMEQALREQGIQVVRYENKKNIPKILAQTDLDVDYNNSSVFNLDTVEGPQPEATEAAPPIEGPPSEPPAPPPSNQGPQGPTPPPIYDQVMSVDQYRRMTEELTRLAQSNQFDYDPTLPPNLQLARAAREGKLTYRELADAMTAAGMTAEDVARLAEETATKAGQVLNALSQMDKDYLDMLKADPEMAKALVGANKLLRDGIKSLEGSELGHTLWQRSADIIRKNYLSRLATTFTQIWSTNFQMPLDMASGAIAGLGMRKLNPKKWAATPDASLMAQAKEDIIRGILPTLEVIRGLNPLQAAKLLKGRKSETEQSEYRRIVDILKETHPDIYGKLHGREDIRSSDPSIVGPDILMPLLDDIQDPMQRREYAKKLRALKARQKFNDSRAGKLVGAYELGLNKLLVPLSIQEYGFRRPMFVGALKRELQAVGLDLNHLLANPTKVKDHEAIIHKAVDEALRFTWAYEPKRDNKNVGTMDRAMEHAAYNYIQFWNKLGPIGPIAGQAFPRAFTNGLKFAYEWSPFGVLNPVWDVASKLKHGEREAITFQEAQRLSQALVGTTMYAIALGLREQAGGEEWWQLKTGRTDKKGNPVYFDTRRIPQIAYFLGVADLAKRVMEGNMTDVKAGQRLSELYLNAQRSASPGEMGTIDYFTKMWSGEPIPGTVADKLIKRPAGDFAATFIYPLVNIRDAYAQFNEETGVRKDLRESPLTGPIYDKLPWVRNQLPNAEGPFEPAPQLRAFSPISQGRRNPFDVALGLTSAIGATPITPGQNFAAREFSRLGLSPFRFLKRDPDPTIDRAQWKAMAQFFEDIGKAFERDPSYASASDKEKAARWEAILSGKRGLTSAAKKIGLAANPEEAARRAILEAGPGPLQNRALGLDKEVERMRKQSKERANQP